jgi:hypothetical protein
VNDRERYQFDLNGYLIVKGMLDRETTIQCLEAANDLESHVVETVDRGPSFERHWGMRYHYNEKFGFSSYRVNDGGGLQYIADDFLNADARFDVLVGHERTCEYVGDLIVGSCWINSSELRYRHQGNYTASHMGGPIDARNRFWANQLPGRPFELLVVRILYALHDIPESNGPLCVVPGSHKANFKSPFVDNPLEEPGMIPLPMQAGDALLFTENLRHGGYPNSDNKVRKTMHVMYGPYWVGSQSPAHFDERVHVTDAAWQRYDQRKRAYVPKPSPSYATDARIIDELRHEVAELKGKLSRYEKANPLARLFKRP